jgi:enoyl-CoA hydratase/carnithine racemase
MPMTSPSSPDGTIRSERAGAITVLTIDRQAKLNTLTLGMLAELRAASAQARADPHVRAIVITGAGNRAFCAGGSLESTLPAALDAGIDVTSPVPDVRFFSEVDKPVIAAVRGHCVGGGLEIMLGCDLRVASADATFGLPEVRSGLIPGGGSHVRLPAQIPYAVAMELLLLGAPITAQRAYQVGLINRITTVEDNLAEALRLAGRIADNAPVAVQTAKEIVRCTRGHAEGFLVEHEMNSRVLASADAREGVRAFAEHRTPRFEGR